MSAAGSPRDQSPNFGAQFHEAQRLRRLARELALGHSAAVHRFIDLHAYADAAIAIFRHALPDWGFKIVVPPPLPDGLRSEAFACAWRRGEAQAVSHRAATASLAVLTAAESEFAKRRDQAILQACSRCRGLGWYLSKAGIKEMCRHE